MAGPAGIERVHDHSGQFPCPLCEQFRATTLLSSSLAFSVACGLWMETHARYIKPSTCRVYRQYAKSLSAFLKDIPLGELHIGNIRAYQRWRSEHAAPLLINAEIQCVLIPILKEINHWKHIADVYRPLPVIRKRVRQNMSEEEERRLIAVALDASKPKRLLAGHCLVIMANTGMGFGELRHLKREDVILDAERPIVTVNEGVKNEYRIRTIPLNWLALRSIKWVLHRWADLGGTEPTQYILPHHAHRSAEEKASKGHKRKSPPVFTEPMGNINKAAQAILNEAGLSHLTCYDMRSHFATKLLSDPDVSDQLFSEIFGHGHTRTRDRYSKQRIEKKAVAIEKLCVVEEHTPQLVVFPGRKK